MTADLHARIAQLEAERDDYKADALRLHKFATNRLDEIIPLKADLAKAREDNQRPTMWCQACGTVTRNGECDCTSMQSPELQDLQDYAREFHRQSDEAICALTAERDALRERVEKDYARLPGLLRYLRNLMIFTEPVAKLLAGGGPHEWGYRDITDGTFIADNAPFEMAGTLEAIRQALDGEKG